VPHGLVVKLPHTLLAFGLQRGAAPLEMGLPGMRILPRGIDRAQRMADVAPNGDVQRERIAELGRIVADPDDGARGGEAEVRRIAASVLAVAHAAHDVIPFLGEGLDAPDVVRVMQILWD